MARDNRSRIFTVDPPPRGTDPVLVEWVVRQLERVNNTTVVISEVEDDQDDTSDGIRQDLDAHKATSNEDHQIAHNQLTDMVGQPVDNPHGMMRWRGRWDEGFYAKHDVVDYKSQYTRIAIEDNSEEPGPSPIGDAAFLYEGASPTSTITAKTLFVGQRYQLTQDVYVTGYRVYTVVGNYYRVFSIRDPDGINDLAELISFEANTTGWMEFTVTPAILPANDVLELWVAMQQPDPSPIIISATWDYITPTGTDVWSATWQVKRENGNPSEGEANSQSNGDFRVHIIDKDDVNQDAQLGQMSPGDTYRIGGNVYTIQTIARNGGGGGHYRITPTPTTRPQEDEYDIEWTRIDYQIPQSGECIQNDNLKESLRFHKTPQADGPIDLSGLTVGDIINGPSEIRWAIQGITENTDWWDFTVSPAQQTTPQGPFLFEFETVVSTPITVVRDVDHWSAEAQVSGSYIVDSGTPVVTEDQYSVDLKIQAIYQSDKWETLP